MSIRRAMTETGSTLRYPAMVSGKRGEPTPFEGPFSCTPLDPADPDIVARTTTLKDPGELLMTFVLGNYDIHEGDVLVVNDNTYNIRACGDWLCKDGVLKYLLVVQKK